MASLKIAAKLHHTRVHHTLIKERHILPVPNTVSSPKPSRAAGRLRALAMACLCALIAVLLSAPPAQANGPRTADRPAPRPTAPAEVTEDDRLARIISRSPIAGQTTAILIDVATGAILAAHQPRQPMPPASVTKVLTTLYGIDRLGRDHAFNTRLIATGPTEGGILKGDLILAGGGDPELDTDELARLVDALTDLGITRVSGRFLYDDSALPRLSAIGSGQPTHAAYNPGLSGLNLNFNRVFFEWEPTGTGINLRLEARDQGHSPPVASSARITAEDRAGPVYLYSQQGGADTWSIARGALRKPGGVWLPVRDPGAYAADAFSHMAFEAGISLPVATRADPGTVRAGGSDQTTLAAVHRRPLHEVCRGMLHFSTNVTAELIGLSASRTFGPVDSLPTSARRMSGWLAGRYGTTSQSLQDHSGLSGANRISAADMARIIERAEEEALLDGLLRRHFVARPGSNQPAVKGAEVRAKTGTLNFVRALAGTIDGASGQQLAFAIFSADPTARATADHTRTNPPGARRFNRRAVVLEQAILAQWLQSHAQ